MTRGFILRRGGPQLSIQDMGRSGALSQGLSRGGAADRLALVEGAALLGQPDTLAAIEMAGLGGEFEATAELRIALTGAPMRAEIDGVAVVWNASHLVPRGGRLKIGGVLDGNYGYLHVGGGFDTLDLLGSRSDHRAAGVGRPLDTGMTIPVGKDTGDEVGFRLEPVARFGGGVLRIVPSLQTDLFPVSERDRFIATAFRRDARGNRMGAPLVSDGDRFGGDAGLSVLSEVVVPGDIQITGDGTPFVLLAECQTTGGYPRIGTVIPCDIPRAAQAGAGSEIRFVFVTMDEALAAERAAATERKALRSRRQRLVRRPQDIRDLLSYQLISGMTAGRDAD